MKLNILLLCNKPNVGNDANTIVDHIEAFEHYSEHNIWLCTNFGELSRKLELHRFDAVIIHYSLSLLYDYYLCRKSKKRLRDFQGLKVVFVQDEYRQINKMIEELSFINVDVLFTCFPEKEIERIYSNDKLQNVRKENNLTGYIPERLTKINNQPLMSMRPVHIGYRGRKLPFWYGELAFEKWSIVDKWHQYTKGLAIKSDVSYHEKDRIYGHHWNHFLTSCKATLGVESGASIMDFTGELEKSIDAYQLTHPNESFHSVQEKFLKEHEGKYELNQISPRCFEAIALKTVLILYEGKYSGILKPNHHYISLKKDFSNIDFVLSCLQDNDFLQKMADTAFEEVALNPNYSYINFIKKVDAVIADEFTARNKKTITEPYDPDIFVKDEGYVALKSRIYKKGVRFYQSLPQSCRLVIKCLLRPKIMINSLKRQLFKLLRPHDTQFDKGRSDV